MSESAIRSEISAVVIGTVLARSFGVLRRHLPLFLLLVCLVQGVMIGIHILLLQDFLLPGAISELDEWDPERRGAFAWQLTARIVVIVGGYAVAGFLTMGGNIYIASKDLSGQPARLGEAIAAGLACAPAMFACGIAVIAVLLGAHLLSVLAIIGFALMAPPLAVAAIFGYFALIASVLVRFSVVFPVAVIERPALLAPIARSVALTQGERWRIFGLGLAMLLVTLGSAIFASFLLAVLGQQFGETWPTALAAGIVYLLFGLLAVLFLTIVPAVLYHELRRAKEGVTATQIAEVFD